MNMTLLRSLCECCGTSGRESAVRDLIRAELDRKGIPAEWIRTDRLGNLLVHIPGQQSAKRKIMFSAHMDEVALMVTYIYDDGTLAFDTVGGISVISPPICISCSAISAPSPKRKRCSLSAPAISSISAAICGNSVTAR